MKNTNGEVPGYVIF